jgi:hypothetical protein
MDQRWQNYLIAWQWNQAFCREDAPNELFQEFRNEVFQTEVLNKGLTLILVHLLSKGFDHLS